MSRPPAPDPDDTMVCNDCGTLVQGETARRHFARHQVRCGGSVELRYGWTVRAAGPPIIRDGVTL